MLKVGVAGIKRGNGFVKIFNQNPETKVVAVCDIRKDLKEYAEVNGIKSWYADFDRFIVHDFDIAVIATPFPLHVSQSIDALKAGKYVLSEVPPAYSVEEAKKLLEAVKKAGLYKYMMAANVNYFPFIKNWIKMTDEGKLGRIFYAEAEYVHPLKEIITNPDLNLSLAFGGEAFSISKYTLIDKKTVPLLTQLGIEIIHTPGHTPGSISIRVGNDLFCGDLLFKGAMGRTDLPGGALDDMKNSLKKIRKMNKNLVIYPGHGQKTRLDHELAYNYYLSDGFLN